MKQLDVGKELLSQLGCGLASDADDGGWHQLGFRQSLHRLRVQYLRAKKNEKKKRKKETTKKGKAKEIQRKKRERMSVKQQEIF